MAVYIGLAACEMGWASDQALVLDSPATGTYTIPSAAPFSSVSELRIEIRLVGNGTSAPACGGFAPIWQFGGTLAWECLNSTQFAFADNSISAGAVWNAPAQTDVLLRMQWDGGGTFGNAGCRYVEVWQTSTGRALIAPVVDCRGGGGARSIAGSQTIGSAGNLANMRVDWVRIYDTVEATGGSAPQNGETTCSTFLDWELDGSRNDCSGNGANISMSSPVFVNAPTYPPVAIPLMLTGVPSWMGASNTVTVRAGQVWQLDSTQSFGFCNPDVRKETWQQTGGPAPIAFSSRTATQPTVIFPQTGQYTLQLSESDCNGTASATLTVGAVAADANSTVINTDPVISYMFGSLPLWGTATWPQIDQDHKTLADTYAGQYPIATPPNWNTNLSGTVTCSTANPPVCTGTGTNFQNDFCAGGTTSDGSMMVIKTPNDGWRWGQVTSCQSATQVTLLAAGGWPFGPGPFNYAKEVANEFGCWGGGSDNCNYYDNVLAYYSLYYRSGLTAYLNYARTLASIWINNPGFAIGFDGNTYPGNQNLSPRQVAFSGMAWWAHETGQGTGVWNLLQGIALSNHVTTPATAFFDVREQAYALRFYADLAVLDPSGGSTWVADVNAAITNNWGPLQLTSGPGQGIWVNLYAGSQDANATSITLTHGSNVVQVNGANSNFTVAYTTANPGQVNVVGNFPGCCTITGSYTGGANGTFTIDQGWPYATMTLSQGQYQVNSILAGTGTEPFIAGLDGNMAYHWYLATNNSTAKNFPVNVATFLQNEGWRHSDNGMYYSRVNNPCEPQSYAEVVLSNCTIAAGASPTLATTIQNDRYLTGEALGAFSGAYLLSPTPAFQMMGDTLVGAALGGGGGPYSDSNYVRTNDGKHKTFGFFWGVGNSPSWSSSRIGGLMPPGNRTISVGFRLASVQNATQVRVTLTKPDGSTSVATCSSSPCVVTGDGREGQHTVSLAYLSASGSTVGRSVAQMIVVE